MFLFEICFGSKLVPCLAGVYSDARNGRQEPGLDMPWRDLDYHVKKELRCQKDGPQNYYPSGGDFSTPTYTVVQLSITDAIRKVVSGELDSSQLISKLPQFRPVLELLAKALYAKDLDSLSSEERREVFKNLGELLTKADTSGQKASPKIEKPPAIVTSGQKASPKIEKPPAIVTSGQKASPKIEKPPAIVTSGQKASPKIKNPMDDVPIQRRSEVRMDVNESYYPSSRSPMDSERHRCYGVSLRTLWLKFIIAAVGVIILIVILLVMISNSKKAALAEKEKARIEQEAAKKKDEYRKRKIEESVKNRAMEEQKAIEETAQKAEIEKRKAVDESLKLEGIRQEQWDVAAKSANQAIADKSNFETAIASLENIKSNCKGTKFESMADTEIMKLVKMKDDLEEEKRLAIEAAKKVQSGKEPAELTEKKKSDLLESLADDIMKQDYKAALTKFTKKNMLLPELKEILEPLSKSNEIILSSFKNEVGKTIFIGLENRMEKSRIIKVEGEYIYCEQPVGKSLIVTKYSLKELNLEEKIKRLSTVNPVAVAIYKGVSEAKTGKFDDATSTFDNAGILSQALKKEIDEMKTRIKPARSPAIDKR